MRVVRQVPNEPDPEGVAAGFSRMAITLFYTLPRREAV